MKLKKIKKSKNQIQTFGEAALHGISNPGSYGASNGRFKLAGPLTFVLRA